MSSSMILTPRFFDSQEGNNLLWQPSSDSLYFHDSQVWSPPPSEKDEPVTPRSKNGWSLEWKVFAERQQGRLGVPQGGVAPPEQPSITSPPPLPCTIFVFEGEDDLVSLLNDDPDDDDDQLLPPSTYDVLMPLLDEIYKDETDQGAPTKTQSDGKTKENGWNNEAGFIDSMDWGNVDGR